MIIDLFETNLMLDPDSFKNLIKSIISGSIAIFFNRTSLLE